MEFTKKSENGKEALSTLRRLRRHVVSRPMPFNISDSTQKVKLTILRKVMRRQGIVLYNFQAVYVIHFLRCSYLNDFLSHVRFLTSIQKVIK